MANNCFYTMIAVSKNKQSLKRLLRIMDYEDDGYFIYRCFEAYSDDIEHEGNLFAVRIQGDVAWSASSWFETVEKPDELIMKKWDTNKPEYGTAHYITLDLLCKKLDIGVELYSEESGCCFQEHYLVNHKGDILISDSVEWYEEWYDEDGNELNEPVTRGGFEYYLDFEEYSTIYGEW